MKPHALAAVVLASLAGCSGDPPAAPQLTACSLTRPALSDFRLRAEGTQLRDALGRVVVLRGVNAGGRSKLPPFAPFDFADGAYDAALGAYLDRAASWGINTLRVPFTWEAVEPTEGADDEAFLKRYDALLDAAWKRGMFTVVDFHQDIYAAVLCGDGFPAWTLSGPQPAPHHDCPGWGTKYLTDPAVRAAFDAFWADGSKARAAYEKLWDRVATRYGDWPGVIGFEPFNEPAPGSADPDLWEATTLTTFYTGIAARIHAAAPASLVFLDATGIDSILASTQLARPQGDGIVFAPHYYQPAALNGSTPDPGSVRGAVQRWANVGAKWKVPVLLGEFGATSSTPGATGYLTAHFDALDALGVSGTEWEYSTSPELWNAEDLSLVAGDGNESPLAAAIVRPFARAVAGDGVVLSYQAASQRLDLRYTPASSGITEIAVPERAYPTGHTVTITGGCFDASIAGTLLVRADAGAGSVEVKIAPR
ncbi:MAG: cellulase family glycosylhydrolase [Byssovorax sp.]